MIFIHVLLLLYFQATIKISDSFLNSDLLDLFYKLPIHAGEYNYSDTCRTIIIQLKVLLHTACAISFNLSLTALTPDQVNEFFEPIFTTATELQKQCSSSTLQIESPIFVVSPGGFYIVWYSSIRGYYNFPPLQTITYMVVI